MKEPANPYHALLLSPFIDFLAELPPATFTRHFFKKIFEIDFNPQSYSAVFKESTSDISIHFLQIILDRLGYKIVYSDNKGVLESSSLPNLLRKILEPYRPCYLQDNGLVTRTQLKYLMYIQATERKLQMTSSQFTNILYALNIKIDLQKI